MGNLKSGVFGLIKMSSRVPKKRSAKILGKEIRPKVFEFSGNGQTCLRISKRLKFP